MEPTTPQMGMSRPGPGLGRTEDPATAFKEELSRAQRRRLGSQQRANQRRQEKTRDAVQSRISQGLDLLRYLMAQRVGIPVEHIGVIIEGGQARAYDVRGGSLLPAQEEAPAAEEPQQTALVEWQEEEDQSIADDPEPEYAWGRAPR